MLGKTAVALALALAFAPIVAIAQRPYVDIEQHLTAEQLREVGLSPVQLELLTPRLLKIHITQCPFD